MGPSGYLVTQAHGKSGNRKHQTQRNGHFHMKEKHDNKHDTDRNEPADHLGQLVREDPFDRSDIIHYCGSQIRKITFR